MTFFNLNKLKPFLMLLAGLAMVGPLSAAVLLDYGEDFSAKEMKPGLRHQWNPEGVAIGNRSGYLDLEANGNGSLLLVDGRYSNCDHPSALGRWLRVYRLELKEGMEAKPGLKYDVVYVHPGQPAIKASDSLDHYVVIAYTLQAGEAGNISITGSTLKRTKESDVGKIKLYVNDRLVGEDVFVGLDARSFDVSLGRLKVGDTIYIALGPGEHSAVAWFPDFKIESN